MTGRFLFIGAKNTDDLRDLTLNNFTLCRGDGLHDPNMPFGKRFYVPRGSHPLKIFPKKGWPQFSGLMCMFSTASSTREKTTPLNLRFQKRKNINKNSSEVSAKSGKFYDKFHLFQGRFFPQWTRWESRSFTLFFCCFLFASQAAEAEPEEAGPCWFCWGEIEGSVKGGISCGSGSGKRISLHLEMEDGRWKKHGKSEFDGCHLNPIEGLK